MHRSWSWSTRGRNASRAFGEGPLELPESIVIGAQIAEALAAAHASNLTHRDLKPSNVMFTRTGAKLLDFGLARVRVEARLQQAPAETTATDSSVNGMLIGTLQYMAPEQIEGGSVDHRADIFALGAVLYEMITGRAAFSGRSRGELIALILKGNPHHFGPDGRTYPTMLAALVKTCLAKNPLDRWQSAADVATTLKTISSAPVRRRSEGPADHGSRAMRSLVVSHWTT